MCIIYSDDHLDAIYDINIAYPYNFPQNEPELLKGNFPREVHFHIKRHPVEDLPESEEGLSNWCKEVKSLYRSSNYFVLLI